MSLRVRPALPGDAAGVVAVQGEAAAERRSIAAQPEEVATPASEAARIRAWAPQTGTLLVAEEDGRIVGICGVARGRRMATAHAAEIGLTVAASHRGRGVGRALMLAAEAWAREAGVRRLGLGVFADNEPALRLYRSLGYAEEGVRRGAFLVGGILRDEVVMAKWT